MRFAPRASLTVSLKSIALSACPPFLRKYTDRIEASPLGYRLARGFFWSLAGTVLSRALSLASTILVARMLGKVGMGELGIIQSTVGIFSAFAGLGMGLTATKYVAEYRRNDPARAGAIIGLSNVVSWISGALMVVVMFVLAPWFAEHTLAAPQLTPLLRIGSLLLLFGALNGAQTGALSGFEAFKTIARVNLLGGLATFPLMVGGAWWLGLEGATWGLVAGLVVNCIVNHIALRQEAARFGVPISRTFERRDWGVMWKFSVPGLLSNLAYGPANWACSALLVNRPGGYGEMGVYNAANNWFNAVVFLPSILGQVVLPLLAGASGDTGSKSPRKVVMLSMKANAAAVLPVVLLGSIGSPFIMALYGPGFREGWLTMVLVMVTAAVFALHTPVAQWMVASARMWAIFFMTLAWSVVYLATAWALVRWGSTGLATARLTAYLLNAAWVFGFGFAWLRESESAPARRASD